MSDARVSSSLRNGHLILRRRPVLSGPRLVTTGLLAGLLLLPGCVDLRTVSLTAPAADTTCTADAAKAASGVSALDPTGMVHDASSKANTAITSNNAVLLLQASLQSVRYETTFNPLAKLDVEKYSTVLEEAATLVRKDRARVAAQQNKIQVAEADAPDLIEDQLLQTLPAWAGKPSTFLPLTVIQQLQQNANVGLKTILDNTSTVLDLTTRYSSGKAALIPQTKAPAPASDAAAAAPPASSPPVTAQPILASMNPLEHHQLLDSLETLAGYRAFHVLTLLSAAHIHEMLRKPDLPSLNELNDEVRIYNVNRFLSTYFDAYFRGGQFFQFTADQKAVADTLSADIKKAGLKATDTLQVSTFLQNEFTQLCKGPNNSSICAASLGQTAFVTRSGLSVQFSGISYDVTTTNGLGLSHNYPQLSQFGPQMIRVLIEAVFDANGLMPPAVPNSTACQEGLFTGTNCLTTGDKNQTSVQQIDTIASSFESVNSMATGVLIRGLNQIALNNEAVSQSIETLIGVIARKITERVLYAATVQSACPVPVPKLKVQATTTTTTALATQ